MARQPKPDLVPIHDAGHLLPVTVDVREVQGVEVESRATSPGPHTGASPYRRRLAVGRWRSRCAGDRI